MKMIKSSYYVQNIHNYIQYVDPKMTCAQKYAIIKKSAFFTQIFKTLDQLMILSISTTWDEAFSFTHPVLYEQLHIQ